MYRPIPLSPPVTYHRPSLPMPPYHHTFKGLHMHHTYKGQSPPVSYHPHHNHKGPFHHKWKGPCPKKTDPTVPATPVLLVPTLPPPLPETTAQPTLPATSVVLLNTTTMPLVVTTVAPVQTTPPVTLPVSTQSGLFTTVGAVETGRLLPVRFAFPPNQCCSFFFSKSGLFVWSQICSFLLQYDYYSF